jgi:hypothetical protein
MLPRENKRIIAKHWWLMPVILTTYEAGSRRMEV